MSFSAQKFFDVSVEIAWVSCSVTRQKFALFQSNCNICHYRTRAILLQFLYVSKTASSILQKKDLFWSIPFFSCLMKPIPYVHIGDEILQAFSVSFFGPILFKTARKCKFHVYFLDHESPLNPILRFSFLSTNFINWKASSRTFASKILILFTILWFLGKFLDNVLGNVLTLFGANVLIDFMGVFGYFFTIFTYVV